MNTYSKLTIREVKRIYKNALNVNNLFYKNELKVRLLNRLNTLNPCDKLEEYRIEQMKDKILRM
jgi:recombination DNA repair RAD52 pathway protein